MLADVDIEKGGMGEIKKKYCVDQYFDITTCGRSGFILFGANIHSLMAQEADVEDIQRRREAAEELGSECVRATDILRENAVESTDIQMARRRGGSRKERDFYIDGNMCLLHGCPVHLFFIIGSAASWIRHV